MSILNQEEFDCAHGYIAQPLSFRRKVISQIRRSCLMCSRDSIWLTICRIFPIIRWLPKYKWRENAIPDVIAGCTVGIMQIPQGMAYGDLAGIDPVHGLYTSFFPSLFYLFMGTSHHISLGTFAVICLMIAGVRYRLLPSADDDDFISSDFINNTLVDFQDNQYTSVDIGASLCLLVGIIQLLMGILRLGFLSAYLSDQLVSGFTTGAAVHVLVAQLDKVFGFTKSVRYNGPGKLYFIVRDFILLLPTVNVATLVISLVSIVVLYVTKEIISPHVKRKCKFPIPIELVVVIAGTMASYYGDFEQKYNVTIVGSIPTGLPRPSVPRFDLMPLFLTDAFSISIVVFSISVSMGKIFAKRHKYKIDANQEFSALGFMECASSFFECFPSSGSLGRSMVFEGAGAKSQLAAVVSSSIILVVILWLGPFFQALPKCVLSSVIMVALKGLFMHFKDLPTLWRTAKVDFLIWIVSFLACVILDVTWGLVVCVCFALFTVILRIQWPSAKILGRIHDTNQYVNPLHYSVIDDVPGIRIFRFNAPLNFLNAELFEETLLKKCVIDLQLGHSWRRDRENQPDDSCAPEQSCDDENGNDLPPEECSSILTRPFSYNRRMSLLSPPDYPHHVIIDCTGFNYVDTMGVSILNQIFAELEKIGVRVFFAGVNSTVQESFDRAHLYSRVPKRNFFLTVNDAVVVATL